MSARDVGKSWHDPQAGRRATVYCAVVVGLAAIATAVFLTVDRTNVALGAAVPAVFLAGGIGALIVGYRAYRRGGTWPIWQGAAWLLFALMLVALSMPMLTLRQ